MCVRFRECGHDWQFKIDPCQDYQEDYADDYFLDPPLLITTQQEPKNFQKSWMKMKNVVKNDSLIKKIERDGEIERSCVRTSKVV